MKEKLPFYYILWGLGCLPYECHLTVLPDVQPKIDAQRRIPFALQDRLKEELDRMTRLNVIEKVSKPTKWVSSIVIVEKSNNKLRICLDPRNLNEAIQRSHFPLPTIEDIRSKLHGAKIFSHLDAFAGFWMIPLDSESSDLCTFNTPLGRYKFKRLPFGLNCSTEIFSKTLVEAFSDIPGVIIYIDDILVYSTDEASHVATLQKVFNRAESINLKFQKEKCVFQQNEIKFLGQIFSAEGMRPDYDKIKAICEMPTPNCQKSLQRFLGMINFLGTYIKNLSTETEIFRNLLKKDSMWLWDENHNKAFQRLKDLITKSPILCHYDNTKPLTLSVDASQSALGAVLLQCNKPIAYASKTLTDCQKRYAQIEKELFAILFGCQKFHQYVYGRKINVETDHKPLITLFKKPLSQVPNRLQRMMLSLQVYDLNVTYVQGSKLYISDTLSRAALLESEEHSIDNDIAIHANMFISSLSVSEERLQIYKKETLNDSTLQKLLKYFIEGWPIHKNKTELCVRQYWNYRSEIHVIDGLVFKNTSLIIPTSLRKEMLQKVHAGHLGISRSKNLVRGVIFWPNMNTDIEQVIENCQICSKFRHNNSHEPLIVSEIPKYPWEKVGGDLLQYKDKKYLVVIDYYSKYIELALLNTGSSAKHVILHFKSIFARHGIPLKLFTDNGPPFDSMEFKEFCTNWDISHSTSSPNFPQSNGQVESAVKIVKNILRKSDEENVDPYLALLHYRSNAKEYMKSPAEMLMSRKLRYNLPIKMKLLKPKTVRFKDIEEKLRKHKENYKKYYDKRTRELTPLNKGDHIWYKKTPNSNWSPGIVIDIKKLSDETNLLTNKYSSLPIPMSSQVSGSEQNHSTQSHNGTLSRSSQSYVQEPDHSTSVTVLPSECQNDTVNDVSNNSQIQSNGTLNVNNKSLSCNVDGNPTMRTRSGRVVRPPVKLDC
ncbi:uncharacterized protein K02A2.6-like [Galleria mellonella]|uniref:RNA-directed DNA polymerase n=1 Tax=Galleria mellonella TaxID=7137 RepID=A0ABM3MLZ7_GALME|nr:uncharacterized protein K02A2.6-like [Galleria mellonella]